MNYLKYPPSATASGQPWMKTEAWRKREIVDGSKFHGLALVLAYVFFGVPALLFGFMGAAIIALFLCVLTYWWLRHLRYGDSVCRLVTLPGVLGGWFKADVECTLPGKSAEPLTVRLKVIDLQRRGTELWRMESEQTVPAVAGKRSIVPVRLRVPRHLRMLLSQAEFTAYLAAGRCAWALDIEKKAAGVDFFASFGVPVYDTQNAPPAEQAD